MEEILKQVNGEVRTILEDALAHGENPRLVALLRAVVTLTNSDEDNRSESSAKSKEDANAKQKAALAAQMADLQKKLADLD